MANYVSDRLAVSQVNLGGGLNDTSGPLSLKDNESSGLQNVDFDKFGSVLTRNGYLNLMTAPLYSSTAAITAFADGGTVLNVNYTTVTSAGHGLSNGNTVVIIMLDSLSAVVGGGEYTVSSAALNTFNIAQTYSSTYDTGNWYVAPDIDGLWWYQSSTLDKLIAVAGDKVYKMDDLDGTFDDITGGLTITAGNHCDFDNFLNTVLVTNNEDLPFLWTGAGNAAAMTLLAGMTKAKFVKAFQNYTILGNVTVSGTAYPSRWYWSTIKTIDTWDAADFIETDKDDGQSITGIKVLGDALVVFKERKIWVYKFTGERDIPFIGYRTSSSVGCVAPWSIQEVDNGLVFLSYDGIYYFDGNTSYKISDRINTTILGLNRGKFTNAVSLVQKDKNRYWLAVTSSGQAENDTVIVWDYFNNAMSVYDGMSPCSMTTVFTSGGETPYFSDYGGFVYQGDTGSDDYPFSYQTAIDSYYYTNWRHFGDIVDQKGVPHIYIYHQYSNSVLSFSYSYDFEAVDNYSQTFSLSSGGDVYGTGVYGTAVYGGSGGGVLRRDLTGMGRVIRFKFATNTLGENFQIDGIGNIVNVETFS